MVDLTNIHGTRQVQTPSAGTPLQAFIAGNSVPSLSRALSNTPPQQLISAYVLATNPKGQVLLQTPQGQVAFTSNVPLSAGQQLVLETLAPALPSQTTRQTAAAQQPATFDVRLVRVNGIPAEKFFTESTATGTPQAPVEAALRGDTNNPAANLLLRALLPSRDNKIQQNPSSAAVASAYDAEAVEVAPSPLQSTTPFKATVLNIPARANNTQQAQGGNTAPATPSVLPESLEPLQQLKSGDVLNFRIASGSFTPAPAATAPATPAPNTPTTATVTSPEGEVTITIPGAQPEDTPDIPTPQNATKQAPFTANAATPSASPLAAAPNTLPAIVIGQEPSGESIVHTPVASLRLPVEIPLPKGTQLSLEVLSVERAPGELEIALLPAPFSTGNVATDALLKGSSTLDTLFKQLFGLNTRAAQNTADAVIPQPGTKQFGNKMLSFLQAGKNDDALDALRQSLPKDQLEKLGFNRVAQEFASLKQATAETPPQQWNFVMVPVMEGDEMYQMRWFRRKQSGGEEDGGEKAGTRFVVELTTENLGNIQLDGLFFDVTKNKQFDLVVRSNQEFSDEEQQGIANIFQSYGQIAGYSGSIRFEEAQQFPVNPMQDIVHGENHEISA